MSTPDEALSQYVGHIVPQRFNAGFVALSYFVSLVGAGSTLELINRRTGSKGLFNNILLASSAATMGGVSIWSMHFVGNRAIDLAHGEPRLQIAFSTGLTVLSFFVPIVVLLAAFVAIGSNSTVSWWRVSLGGLLCGTAVCGMHYLGNSSIENYTCVYKVQFVIGSAIIAVAASTIALSMFFIFRSMWANAWWKRVLSALLLAGAVSGMHWCAAVGTEYRLKSARSGGNVASQNATVIVVICLSIGACLIIAGLAVFTARKRSKTARRAQKITLGAAIFDKQGRILVDPDGLIPSTVVTGSFMQTGKQSFNTDHPHFLWMFQATRNWPGMLKLVDGMGKHLAEATTSPDFGDERQKSENQDEDETHGVIFREQFCMAAIRLAERLRENLGSAGILWDEILPTGATAPVHRDVPTPKSPAYTGQKVLDLAEKGIERRQEQYGRGSLMFLVRRIQNDREAERLSIAGYRFADLEQVGGTISSSMQIQTPGIEHRLREMAEYAGPDSDQGSGVSMGIFGVRARVNGSGFEVLVQSRARHLLPSIALPLSTMDAWQISMLKRFDNMTLVAMDRAIKGMTLSTTRERVFMSQLVDGIQALRDAVQDPILDSAVFTADVVTLPCQEEDTPVTKLLLAFGIVMPIHSVVSSPDYEFVPLSLFKAHQMVQLQQSQLAFVQSVHREFGPIIQQDIQRGAQLQRKPSAGLLSRLSLAGKSWRRMSTTCEDGEGLDAASRRRASSAALSGSSSTVDLCQQKTGDGTPQVIETMPGDIKRDVFKSHINNSPSFGGIMVQEVITVNVETRKEAGTPTQNSQTRGEMSPSSNLEMHHIRPGRTNDTSATSTRIIVGHDGEGEPTFVDDLFQKCVDSRWWQK